MSQSSASAVESRKAEPRKEEAPPGEQRDGLRSLLRGLSFAAQEEALKPGGEAPPGAPPRPPKDKVSRLLSLVPLALEGMGDAETEARPKGASPSAERRKEDGGEKESQEAEQAEQLLDESEAPPEPPERAELEVEQHGEQQNEAQETEAEELSALLEAPTPEAPESVEAPVETPTAPVQMKAKPGAKPAPKPANKPAPKPANKPAPKPANKPATKPGAKPASKPANKPTNKPGAKPGLKVAPRPGATTLAPKKAKAKAAAKASTPPGSQGPMLDAAGCRAAYRWTLRQGFASVPFIVRRYQLVLGVPANGKVEGNWQFVQAVAAFQVKYGVKQIDGKLAGVTARKMRYILQTRWGLDKKNLLTRREVKMAQKKNVAAIQNKQHPLNWKVVRELRKLLDMKEDGGLNAAFLRKVAEFQRKHEIGYSAQITKNTINTMREELGDTWHHPLPGGTLTSPFGMRYHPIKHTMRMHEGVDLAGPTKIVAARAGKVKAILSDPAGYGNYLILSHKDCDTLYAHCASIAVKQGQRVKAGERIATAGETGGSKGVHLHFEVHKPGYRNPVNPEKFI